MKGLLRINLNGWIKMNKTPILVDAMALATEAHKGQFDKSGVAYILHPLRIMHRHAYRN